jgi:hypothetical protein
MQKDDVFIGVSTCFGHHHAHHQENSTKPPTPMVYSTGRAAVNSRRRTPLPLPLILMEIYVGVSRSVLQVLLNQMAAVVLCSFFLRFWNLRISFACWALATFNFM